MISCNQDACSASTRFVNDSRSCVASARVSSSRAALSAATAQHHDHDMLANAAAPGEDVTIDDVTEDFGCLVLAGPLARDVLGAVTDADLSNAAFPWLTARTIEVAGVGLRALRVNYVGELGWELHCPMADMPAVFDALMDAGQPHGLKLFGSYAMNSLRMEKAYRAWGGELTNEITMIEADMERFVRFDREFIGRAATLASRQQGPRIRLAYMEVDAADSDCRGNEPVMRDGRVYAAMNTLYLLNALTPERAAATLLASFGLAQDPALQRLAKIVHCLDVGGLPVSEAAGLERLLIGIRARSADIKRSTLMPSTYSMIHSWSHRRSSSTSMPSSSNTSVQSSISLSRASCAVPWSATT